MSLPVRKSLSVFMDRRILVAASLMGAITGVLAIVFAVMGWTASSIISAFVTVLATVFIGTMSMLGAQRALETKIERAAERNDKHRKDASRWEWRISEQLKGIGAHVPNSSSHVADAPKNVQSGPRSWKNNPEAPVLLRRHLFNAAYYTQISGGSFQREIDAASHFLGVGMAKMQSCTPLIDPGNLPKDVQEQWRRGDIRSILRYLQRPRSTIVQLSDFFAPRIMAAKPEVTQKHPGGCVGWFVENASDEEFLPTTDHAIRWGDYKAAVRSTLASHADTKRLGVRRTVSTWDTAQENRWKAQLRAWARENETEPRLISVVIPVWNREETLGDALDSVRAQTSSHWEAIVVDDGSEDGSVELARRYSRLDPRIRVIEAPHAGVCAARNTGLREARGEFVAFLDSDNTWESDFLELMEIGIRRQNAQISYSAIELRGDDNVMYRAFEGGHEYLRILNHIDLNVLVLSRERALEIGGFDESLRRWVDHDFALRATDGVDPILLPFIGCRYDNSEVSTDRITTTESDNWQWVALARTWVSFDKMRKTLADRVAGRVSVVIPTYRDHEMTTAAVQAVLDTTHAQDVEIIVVDNGSDFTTTLTLRATFASEARVSVIRLPRNMNFATGSNIGAASSSGEYIFFLNNDTEVRAGWLPAILERMQEPGVQAVQPLLQFPDDSIQSAGTVFVAQNALPVPFLVGMPPEDAREVDELDFHALTAAALMMRASTVAQFEGFDPLFVNGMEDIDLCLRVKAETGGRLVVATGARVRHWESRTPGRGARIDENRALFMQRWRDQLPDAELHLFESVGLRVAHIAGDGLPTPAPRITLAKRDHAPQRWGIRYSAVGGSKGDTWGDTAFVHSLADALRELGQDVVTYRHGANTVYDNSVDDVNIVLRGIDKVAPIPGQTNVLWVISHPEDVTLAEIRSFDLVYAASLTWADEMSRRSGRAVHPLFQATDATRFHSVSPSQEITRPATFVGSVHLGRRRGVVEDALAARIPLCVIGNGWRDRLTPDILEADFVPNDRLPEIYRSASRVLADHWPEMAKLGFIQNRVFDAVACGSRVITDPVPGIDRIFGSAVQQYSGTADLRRLCAPGSDVLFPDSEEMAEIAQRILSEHSFSTRARRFIDDVRDHGGPRSTGAGS